ncbi:MAG: DUF1611 domain-containing protein [Gemmataceae bacterium]|nr:DUF1611 domain-containing protein [Gemmataceae bacterium]
MPERPDGRAVVYCEAAFGTTTGKTAHGLVRRTRRYDVAAVIDSKRAGDDAGQALDGRANGIPIVASLTDACRVCESAGRPATHFVIGLAPDGGQLDDNARAAVRQAMALGLHVDSGLHSFLSDDPELAELARRHHVNIRDVRKPPDRSQLHFYSGKIKDVTSLKVAVLGTDSAVGKRTTAWTLIDGLRAAGLTAEMVGTGQTAWLQGAQYSITLDSLINDFVAGELEHAVWSAWNASRPDVIVIEGQGSLMHPAYPGGFEILAACRPELVVMQHAPARREYDGFPGCPVAPLEKQIQAIELVSTSRVVGVTINHEDLDRAAVDAACTSISAATGLPACDVLIHGPQPIVAALLSNRPAPK